MSREYDVLKGIKNTQADYVYVPYGVICNIIGEEIAQELAQAKSGFAQTPSNPGVSSKKAVERAAFRKPEEIAKFDREDLMSVVNELAEEAGGLDKLIKIVEDDRSPLQKIRDAKKASAPAPKSPPKKKEA